MEERDSRYSPPDTDDDFIRDWSPFIRATIDRFNWGGVQHVANASAEDIYQDLILDWIARDYLHVYNSTILFNCRRRGRKVRCTFRNFAYQFVSQRLLSVRDKFNRQSFCIRTELVPTIDQEDFHELIMNGVRYVYKRKFIRHIRIDDKIANSSSDNDSTIGDLLESRHGDHVEGICAVECFKRRCTDVYTELRKMRVVSKRNFAKLFLAMVKITWVTNKKVQQAELAGLFEVSTSTISLMIKQMRSIPIVREFEHNMAYDAISQ